MLHIQKRPDRLPPEPLNLCLEFAMVQMFLSQTYDLSSGLFELSKDKLYTILILYLQKTISQYAELLNSLIMFLSADFIAISFLWSGPWTLRHKLYAQNAACALIILIWFLLYPFVSSTLLNIVVEIYSPRSTRRNLFAKFADSKDNFLFHIFIMK